MNLAGIKEENDLLFDDLIGQRLARSLLDAALEKGRIAPAYFFSGPNGVGRKLAALRFFEGVLSGGNSLIRERRRLQSLNHPDFLLVEPTYKHQGNFVPQSLAIERGVPRRTPPQIRLEQIREVTQFLSRKPVEAKRGMVLIEGVECMGEAAANALLKTLEEPGHGLLILLSAAPERVLTTIHSRCQRIPFFGLDRDSIEIVLKKSGLCDLESLNLNSQPELFALAAGSPGALMSHMDQWKSFPSELLECLVNLPTQPIDALALARDLSEALDGEQQIWLIDWLQQRIWLKTYDPRPLKRLERLRSHLLRFAQPRLAWEVTFLELMQFV